MNKADLVDKLAKKSDLTKKNAEVILNAFIETIKEGLAEDGKIQLVGFGTFEVKHRKERTARNPRTQEEITIPATDVPTFKAGKELKEAVIKK